MDGIVGGHVELHTCSSIHRKLFLHMLQQISPNLLHRAKHSKLWLCQKRSCSSCASWSLALKLATKNLQIANYIFSLKMNQNLKLAFVTWTFLLV